MNMAAPVGLDESNRLVVLQFSFGKWNEALRALPRKSDETFEEKARRKGSLPAGEMFLEPTERVDVSPFITDIERDGYELVDAFWKKRIGDGEYGNTAKFYHMAQFTFCRREHAEITDVFRANRRKYLLALAYLAKRTFWKTRGFINPLQKNSRTIDEVYVINIPLHLPVHRFQGNGQPVTEWDEWGKVPGEKAPPIRPAWFLGIRKNQIRLF